MLTHRFVVDTSFTLDESKLARFAHFTDVLKDYAAPERRLYRGSIGEAGNPIFCFVVDFNLTTETSLNAGLHSTMTDYHKFLRTTFGLGTSQLLSRKSQKYLLTNQLSGNQNVIDMMRPQVHSIGTGHFGFSSGMAIVTEQSTPDDVPKGSVWWGAGSASRFWYDPEQEVIVIFVSSKMLVRYSQNLRIGLQRLVRAVVRTDDHVSSLTTYKPLNFASQDVSESLAAYARQQKSETSFSENRKH